MSKSTLAIIVSPNVLLREAIASFLQNSRFKVVGLAAKPSELPPACCPKGQRALAIVGVDRENGGLDDAAESIRLLRTLMSDGKVVLVAATNAPIDLQRVLALTSDACIFDLGSRDTLIKVLELARSDQRVFLFGKSMAATAKSDDELTHSNLPLDSFRLGITARAPLSSRERDVLFYLAQGKSNKVIARACQITEATVKVHLKSILRKTNTQNRTQAAIWAIEQGFWNQSSEHKGSRATDAPTLPPAGATTTVRWTGVITASRDDGFPPVPPSARHPGSDRPLGR